MGFVVIAKRYLLKPDMPREIFDSITNMGIPLGIYRRVPDFLVNRFQQALEYFKGNA